MFKLFGIGNDKGSNPNLNKVLDEQEEDTSDAAVNKLNEQLTGEHAARIKAEADAANNRRRLTIAQEQLAEYAAQRERDMGELLSLFQRAEGALGAAGQGTSPAELQQLRQRMLEAMGEAETFAKQQRDDISADAERMKRSISHPTVDASGPTKRQKEDPEDTDEEAEAGGAGRAETTASAAASRPSAADADMKDDDAPEDDPSTSFSVNFSERARYIPMRLDHQERRLLRLLEACLLVSEYTDKVDILSWKGKQQRIHAQIKYICSVLSGLVVAENYREGQKLVTDRNFADNSQFFRDVFEVGRRYKIMNPDRMRATYGMLLYMLMDSCDPQVQDLLDFKCVRPLRTVRNFLEEKGAALMLDDPLLVQATAEIQAGDRPRAQIQVDIKRKERARSELARRYRTMKVSEEELLSCIYSISDENTYLRFNKEPVDKLIQYLTTYFQPDRYDPGCSLAIAAGRDGARLSHNHERQYIYVLQSLTLWSLIMEGMFKLWCLAEEDMLSETNLYRLGDTGQGLQRMQDAPRVYREMQRIITRAKGQLGHWVGSSVVHLGDHNVPNALMFIDKYSQVPRILNPVVLVLDEIPKVAKDPHVRQYIDSAFGSVDGCIKAILSDFFRHAFDGSGADNFVDAGSCIDGRLTSAWNWCSKIEKKPYYHIFKVCGFVSFDGDWKG